MRTENLPTETPETENLASNTKLYSDSEVKSTEGMLLHKHEKQAIDAHRGTSFSPERRGRYYIKEYSELLAADIERVKELGGDFDRYREKFERLFSAWLYAKSNCLSTMIAGPSKFPVRRAEKANRSEEKRYKEFSEWRERALEGMARAKRKAERAEVDPIAELKEKIKNEKAGVEFMKAVNKVIRAKKLTDEQKVEKLGSMGIPASVSEILKRPDCFGNIGFASYKLTNANARIRSSEKRLKELEKRATAQSKENERADGVRIVENVQENRLQVFFPGKPEASIREKLKANGFRWAPSNGCWQAYLNNNSKYKLERFVFGGNQ